jgi:hypothetical protein
LLTLCIAQHMSLAWSTHFLLFNFHFFSFHCGPNRGTLSHSLTTPLTSSRASRSDPVGGGAQLIKTVYSFRSLDLSLSDQGVDYSNTISLTNTVNILYSRPMMFLVVVLVLQPVICVSLCWLPAY